MFKTFLGKPQRDQILSKWLCDHFDFIWIEKKHIFLPDVILIKTFLFLFLLCSLFWSNNTNSGVLLSTIIKDLFISLPMRVNLCLSSVIYQLLPSFVAPWIFTSLYKAKDYRFIVFLSSLTLSFSSFLKIDLLNGRVLGNISLIYMKQ